MISQELITKRIEDYNNRLYVLYRRAQEHNELLSNISNSLKNINTAILEIKVRINELEELLKQEVEANGYQDNN